MPILALSFLILAVDTLDKALIPIKLSKK